ncbi:YcaO-like family protein [Streptosporangium sp. NPDC020072]|uniref:YcaO-like family protein n=1 Tax=Streptosporangium sp. NPDC020072 TaxID=3154788 RepID=UPI00342C9BAD
MRGADVPARACAELARRLTAAGQARWVIGRPSLPETLVLIVTHRQADHDALARTLRAGRLLRVGESFEGLYVTGPGPLSGPLSGSLSGPGPDRRWAFEHRLAELGLHDRPSTTLWRLRVDPDGLVRAVLAATRHTADDAVLADSGRRVSFATPAALRRTAFRNVPDTQAWTFGMVRGLKSGPGAVAGSRIATCRTPASGQDHLEGNSGKGTDPQAAVTGAVGEAVERYTAYEANWSLPPAAKTSRRVDLAQFHPYGDVWDRGPAPTADYVDGTDLTDHTTVAVPKALVTFPYVGADRPTYGGTTGLAAAPDVADATLRGLREVLERDSLYHHFTGLRPAYRLDTAASLRRLRLTGAFRGDLWVLHWPNREYLMPDVHAFHHDPHTGLLVRSSGSGLTFDEAVDSAMLELCQVYHEGVRAHRAGAATSTVHARWRRPSVIDECRRYLDSQRPHAVPEMPYHDAPGQLEHLVRRLAAADRGPIVVRLPLRGPDWTVVRVLVPGAATVPYASASRGGARLPTDAPWRHGIPT